jgi:hypothetical protein
VAAKNDDLFQSCVVTCTPDRLRKERTGDRDDERNHKTDQDNHTFEHRVVSPVSMDEREITFRFAVCNRPLHDSRQAYAQECLNQMSPFSCLLA